MNFPLVSSLTPLWFLHFRFFYNQHLVFQINLGLSILHARKALGTILANWSSSAPRINAELLNCENNNLALVLDVLNRDSSKLKQFEKVNYVHLVIFLYLYMKWLNLYVHHLALATSCDLLCKNFQDLYWLLVTSVRLWWCTSLSVWKIDVCAAITMTNCCGCSPFWFDLKKLLHHLLILWISNFLYHWWIRSNSMLRMSYVLVVWCYPL